MRLDLQREQRHDGRGLAERRGERDRARVKTAGAQGEPHLEHVDEQLGAGQPRAQPGEHALQHGDERRHRRDLPVEPLRLRPERRRRPRAERRAIDADGEVVRGQARPAEPGSAQG